MADYCTNSLEDFQEEVRRRYPDMPEIELVVQGISVPFSYEELGSRAQRLSVKFPVKDIIRQLWESGFLGLEIRCNPANQDPEKIMALFPDRTHAVHRNSQNQEFHRWYLFVYNWKGEPDEVVTRFSSDPNVKINCVLHASTFEQFPSRVTQEWPVGI